MNGHKQGPPCPPASSLCPCEPKAIYCVECKSSRHSLAITSWRPAAKGAAQGGGSPQPRRDGGSGGWGPCSGPALSSPSGGGSLLRVRRAGRAGKGLEENSRQESCPAPRGRRRALASTVLSWAFLTSSPTATPASLLCLLPAGGTCLPDPLCSGA